MNRQTFKAATVTRRGRLCPPAWLPLLVVTLAPVALANPAARPPRPPAQATTLPSQPPFLFFDSTFYIRKPQNLRLRGLWPAICETSGTSEGFARRALAERAILILDLEPLPAHGTMPEAEIDALLAKYEAEVDKARAAAPTVMIGAYAFPNHERHSRSRTADGGWDERGIAGRLNFSAPDAFVYPDQNWGEWEAIVEKRLKVARSFNRPTYVFLNTTHFAEPYADVDEASLRRAIDFIRPRADAILWWGGWYWVKPRSGGPEVFRRYPWSEDAPWLKTMRPPARAPAPATAPASAPAPRPVPASVEPAPNLKPAAKRAAEAPR